MRDPEPTDWPATQEEAEAIAAGTFSHCIGETPEGTVHPFGFRDPCEGCPGWTTKPSGDWCGAVYLPRKPWVPL